MTSRKLNSRSTIANRPVKENIPGMCIFEWRIYYKQNNDERVTGIPKCSSLDKNISQDDSRRAIKTGAKIMKINENECSR